MSLVNQGLDLYPHHTEMLLLRAFLLRRKENYEAALSDLELAYRTLNPSADHKQEDEIRS